MSATRKLSSFLGGKKEEWPLSESIWNIFLQPKFIRTALMVLLLMADFNNWPIAENSLSRGLSGPDCSYLDPSLVRNNAEWSEILYEIILRKYSKMSNTYLTKKKKNSIWNADFSWIRSLTIRTTTYQSYN